MSEGLREVSLPVSGMTCAACARRVEKAHWGSLAFALAVALAVAFVAAFPVNRWLIC